VVIESGGEPTSNPPAFGPDHEKPIARGSTLVGRIKRAIGRKTLGFHLGKSASRSPHAVAGPRGAAIDAKDRTGPESLRRPASVRFDVVGISEKLNAGPVPRAALRS
jgi:hypothetical protein